MQIVFWRSIQNWVLSGMAVVALTAGAARGDVKLPNIFGNHMVLQQNQKNKVWGSA